MAHAPGFSGEVSIKSKILRDKSSGLMVEKWAVHIGKRRYGPWITDHIELERQRKVAAKNMRPCITCQTVFPSQGPHNRMCDGCRSRTSNIV